MGAVSPLATANLGNADLTGGGQCTSFSAEVSGHWGGEYGSGAVTAYGATDPAGYCTFTGLTAKARHISLRVLDGIADDSFDVYVRNPGGNWALGLRLRGQSLDGGDVDRSPHQRLPCRKGTGDTVAMKIVPRNVGWSGFATWGQLAVDWVKVWEH